MIVPGSIGVILQVDVLRIVGGAPAYPAVNLLVLLVLWDSILVKDFPVLICFGCIEGKLCSI